MSVTMNRADGVTVFTLTTDPKSAWPPICQIFKGLCYSPMCCSVSQHLRRVQNMSQSVLGALHIMVGLLNIGLGAILCSSGFGSWWQMDETSFPYWFGGMFILFGMMSILSEKCPSPCLVILNVVLSVVGVGLAIAAIALYSINIAHIRLWWSCRNYFPSYRYTTVSPSPYDSVMKEKCLEAQALVLMLLRSINAVLIVLSVLELCVTISAFILGTKALRSYWKKENEIIDDPEHHRSLLGEVTTDPEV